MKKYLFDNGDYIQFNKKGNSYYGDTAQRIMLLAQKEHRENINLKNVSYNDVLMACLYGIEKFKTERIK